MKLKIVSIAVASLFAGAAFAADGSGIEVAADKTITSADVSEPSSGVWYLVKQGTFIVSGLDDKTTSLTLNNTENGTDAFFRADGTDAVIEVKNLNVLEFKTDAALDGKNANPLIVANGGSQYYHDINSVRFGTAEKPLEVDQAMHLNWGGKSITFKDIGTFDLHTTKTGIIIQNNEKSVPSLVFDGIRDVNIVAGPGGDNKGRYGIQIAASGRTQDSEAHTALLVRNVDNFNVVGTKNALVMTNLSSSGSSTWIGRANMVVDIHDRNVSLSVDTDGITKDIDSFYSAIYLGTSENKSGEYGDLKVKIKGDETVSLNGDQDSVYINNSFAKTDQTTLEIEAPKVDLASKSGGINLWRGEMSVRADDLTVRSTDSTGQYEAYVGVSGGSTFNLEGLSGSSAAARIDGKIYSGEGDNFNVKNTTLTVTGSSADLQGRTSVQEGAFILDGTPLTTGESGEVSLKNASLELVGEATAQINKLTGEKGRILVHNVVKDGKTVTVTDNQLKGLEVGFTGAANDQYASSEEAAKALAAATEVTNGTDGSYTFSSQSGAVSEGWTADATGKVLTRTENEAMRAVEDFNAMTLVHWRSEGNHIVQRLGDVRDGTGKVGAWARVYGYSSSYSNGVSTDYKANSIQAGGDYRVNDTWLVGGAFSYTDGEGTFSNGSSDSDGYSLAAYLSGFFDCGAYVDFVGRVGRLSTDITAASQSSVFKSSYDNTTFGLSAEVGYHWKVNETFYVEPQAEFTYGFVKGDDFTGSNGASISQDDFQSLVGRLGARFGASFAEGAGTVYAHASVNHEFLGDADFTATSGASRDFSVDLSGTWVSYGVGAQFNTSKNINFYGVLERSSGSDYDEDYRYSVGMRYAF